MRPDEVVPALQAVETAIDQHGLTAAGFIAYEAAAAYGFGCPCPAVGAAAALVGLYERADILDDWATQLTDPPSSASYTVGPWQPTLDRAAHATVVRRIKDYLAHGHSYQSTIPSAPGHVRGRPWPFFVDLATAQRESTPRLSIPAKFAVCSASPELFFQLDGERLITRPMKARRRAGGTFGGRRGADGRSTAVRQNRAENLMIVDMLRNDLGRVPETGSVAVPRLFAVERYPTLVANDLHRHRPRVSVVEILASLFPVPRSLAPQGTHHANHSGTGIATCAACTPAPSAGSTRGGGRASTWPSARRWSTGTRARKLRRGRRCGLGFRCRRRVHGMSAQGRVLATRQPPFQLLESLLWEPDSGYFLPEAHLTRLAATATYFSVPFDRPAIATRLSELATTLNAAHKIRLLLARMARSRWRRSH